jgi:hypothetical protein
LEFQKEKKALAQRSEEYVCNHKIKEIQENKVQKDYIDSL